jgi:hypothetical protein
MTGQSRSDTRSVRDGARVAGAIAIRRAKYRLE